MTFEIFETVFSSHKQHSALNMATCFRRPAIFYARLTERYALAREKA